MSTIHALPPTSDHFYVLPSSQEQLNLETLIGSLIFSANITKRLVIPSNIVLGSLSSSTAALIIPAGANGRIIIDNYGEIYGAGGAAGTNGGDAIQASSNCIITNHTGGIIYSGGGGGGTGGTGGTGGQGSVSTVVNLGPAISCGDTGCTSWQSQYPGAYCTGGQVQCAPGTGKCSQCSYNQITYTSGGNGGNGGAGGRGKGYDGNAAAGVAGSAGANGGTNAGAGGTGGTGGSGGDWGTSGSTGATGSAGANGNYTNGLAGVAGSSGGLAGYYINGLSTYVTFTNNGTIAGRSN